MLNSSGAKIGELRYTPFGETRSTWGGTLTDRRFTGQRAESGLGSLYDYGARFYSPYLGRFLSADTIVPDPKNPQSLNRYTYGLNNPVKYRDPSGHKVVCGTTDEGCDNSWLPHPPQQPGGGELLKLDPIKIADDILPTTFSVQITINGGVVVGSGGLGVAAQQSIGWQISCNRRRFECGGFDINSLSAGVGLGAGIDVQPRIGFFFTWGASDLDALEGQSYQGNLSLDAAPILGPDIKGNLSGSVAANSDGSIYLDPASRMPVITLGLSGGLGGSFNPTLAKGALTVSAPNMVHPLSWGAPGTQTMPFNRIKRWR